jgi:Transmembrane secretion effector
VPGFRPLAVSYGLNQLGDMLGLVALAILVVRETDSALATTGLFLAAKFAPSFVAPVVTASLDRQPVARSLPALYVVEAGVFAALALLADAFWLPAVLALAFADGVLALGARGLSRGAVAAVLGPAGELRGGNALLNVLFAACSAAGPLAAGLIIHTGGVALALWLDAASFLACALVLALAARRLPRALEASEEGWLERVRDGLRYVREHQTAGRLVVAEGIAIIFFTTAVPVAVVFATQTLHASSLGYGAMLAAWGAGVILGSVVFARTSPRGSLHLLIIASTAAVGVGYGGTAVAPTLAVACAASVVGGLGNGIQWVSVMTALQEAVADDYQARAAGLLESVGDATPGIGFLLGGVLAAAGSPRLAYAVAGAGALVVAAVWARRPVVPRPVAA